MIYEQYHDELEKDETHHPRLNLFNFTVELQFNHCFKGLKKTDSV